MNTSNVLEPFKDRQKSHVAILGLNTRFGFFRIFHKRKRVFAFIIYETILQIVLNIFGFRLVEHQFTILYLDSIFQKKICL